MSFNGRQPEKRLIIYRATVSKEERLHKAPFRARQKYFPKTPISRMSSTGEQAKVFSSAVYECIRCGTKTSQEELSSLPEVKCICGYRVFKKVRPAVVKQVKAV